VRGIPRKFLAVTALFALLAVTTPALADSLSASDLPACCKTSYCPLHHRQGRNWAAFAPFLVSIPATPPPTHASELNNTSAFSEMNLAV
jgi:hypothetical protein